MAMKRVMCADMCQFRRTILTHETHKLLFPRADAHPAQKRKRQAWHSRERDHSPRRRGLPDQAGAVSMDAIKQLPSGKVCGVYKITSPSGKFYIGSSVNIRSRWSGHKADLRNGKHHCSALQRAANKYGIDALIFEVVMLSSPECVRSEEQALIISMKPSYNSTDNVREPLSNLWTQPEFRKNGIERARNWAKKLRLDDGYILRQKEGAGKALAITHKRPDFAAAHKIRAIARLEELVNTPEIKAKAAKGRRARYENDPVAAEKRRACGREMMEKLHLNGEITEKMKAVNRERMKVMRSDPEARARNLAAVRAAHGHPVRCIETGEVFASIGMAARSLGLGPKNTKTIAKAAKAGNLSAYGFRWSYEPRERKATE